MIESSGDAHESALIPAARVAMIFGINLRTLHNWAEAGVLVPAVRIRGRRYYARADVEHLLAQGRA
ncbi:MerR family transcriptional regulator [Roseomonas sp. CECT 9278]|uniref:MerR family transcriptional regulator n=1 Tax=Roseomonas sp. CECT 9278 TaxID=2845823 RepID=UPI001E5F43A8|nr:MerR family transcriptional regulator [Roseomonas sp. CECT 9278]CAH0150369.1 hypothetical protein ROS9278_00704 [Roseomonas sp. CECT 9278]